MKLKKKKEYDSHKELFDLQGEERYSVIQKLSVFEIRFICLFYKHCSQCPLALYFEDGHGHCCDVATQTDIEYALSQGAKFVEKEDFENEKEN